MLGPPQGEHERGERERHEQREVDVDDDAPREMHEARRGREEEAGENAGRGRAHGAADQERREDDPERAERDGDTLDS